MKRQAGFSLIEVMVATVILLISVAFTLSVLTDAIHANQAVTLMADTQENLRAALNYMVRDIIQAGDGIPQGGITIPNTGLAAVSGVAPPNGQSSVNKPGQPVNTFPTSYTALPAVIPGPNLGEAQEMPSSTKSGVIVTGGPATDTITVLYADNTILDANNHTLSQFPIYLAPVATPAGCAGTNSSPGGSIVLAGTTLTLTFDPTCIALPTGNTAIQPGDLILLQNGTASALMCVTTAAGQVVTFKAGDAFNLNASGQPAGTIAQLESPAASGKFPPTTATRIWMITYYLDTQTNPSHPELMRQVNFNTPEAVGEVIENLQISYDLTEDGSVPPVKTDQPQPIYPDTTSQIRKVNLFLAARSDNGYIGDKTYFRNNLATEVNIRGLSFYNQFQIN
jgi:prepilin-type N-terminal cleavage/methylation domain-containing protein